MIFRAWDKKEKSFWHDFVIFPDGFVAPATKHKNEKWIYDYEYPQKRIVLQRFTGLLDKNKEKIYEGDIVKIVPDGLNKEYLEGMMNDIGEIRWIEEGCEYWVELFLPEEGRDCEKANCGNNEFLVLRGGEWENTRNEVESQMLKVIGHIHDGSNFTRL